MKILLFRDVVRLRCWRWAQISHLDHVSGFLGNHHRWDVRVSRRNRRHYAAIDDPQVLNSINSKLWIDDSHRVRFRSHLRGARRMVNRLRVMLRQTSPKLVGQLWILLASRHDVRVQRRVECAKNFRSRQFVRKFRSLDL